MIIIGDHDSKEDSRERQFGSPSHFEIDPSFMLGLVSSQLFDSSLEEYID